MTVTLDDVFRHYTGDTLDNQQGGIRDVRRARRTARRLTPRFPWPAGWSAGS
jgi:hypothetical protein